MGSQSADSDMGTARTEKELKEETRARRARHDLKNTPLPVKHEKRLFNDGGRKREGNKAALSRLTSQRLVSGLAHTKSLTDLRPDTQMDAMVSSGRLASTSVSCENLLRYIGGGGRYKVSCQDLIDKYSSEKRSHHHGLANSRQLSKSCSNLLERDWTGGQDLGMGQRSKSYSRITEEKRSKSYSRITEEKSSYDQVLTLSQEKTLEKLSPFQKKESY